MKISLKRKYHEGIFFFGLAVLIISLPLSKFGMSLAQFILLGNWIWEGNFKEKWQRLKSNKTIWAVSAIYFFLILGLLWTSDFSYGMKDLRVKLPMLALPIILGSSQRLRKIQFRNLLINIR